MATLMDAPERDPADIAREYLAFNAAESGADHIISALLYALEQARKERDEAIALNEKAFGAGGVLRLLAQRDAAQQDAKDARALLKKKPACSCREIEADLLARIEAMLEKKK